MLAILRFSIASLALASITTGPARAALNNSTIEAVSVPDGFQRLTSEREELVDLYFGGQKIGATRVITRPGSIRFRTPDDVFKLLPDLLVAPATTAALEHDLDTNVSRVCGDGVRKDCGDLSPAVLGIIYDENHFRVDLFVNPKWLRVHNASDTEYLSTPTSPLSLTSSFGFAMAGSNTDSPTYNLQNRAVVGLRNARVRADSSYASKLGFAFDDLVAEVDRRALRYSAGLFWAPGVDLIGQRRIVGLGAATQFDTRVDHDSVSGTPLIVSLSRRARVDVIVDGRLATSGLYEPGNNLVDTSSLPDGSYSVKLQIYETNGDFHEETRFFVKNPRIAPLNEPIYFAYAGMLADIRRGQPISISHEIYYQFGTARRLSSNFAVDLSLVGTSKKPMVEAGAWLLTSFARARAAGLVSAAGDRGLLLQVASADPGWLTFNFDLRRIWARDNKPLIPLPNYIDTFTSGQPSSEDVERGSYTQLLGSLGARIGSAYVAVTGSLRRDSGREVDYSIGPSIIYPIVNRSRIELTFEANAQATRTTAAAYVGFRMLFASGGFSVVSTGGHRAVSGEDDSQSLSRQVGSVTAQYAYNDQNLTDISVSGGIERDEITTAARAAATVYSRFGNIRGQLIHAIEGANTTQFAISGQSGAVLDRSGVIVGGRNLQESALVVSVAGNSTGAEFEVLINGQPRGRLEVGHRLPIFLPPYHEYRVRLRPVNSKLSWFDASTRRFVLYPGNVQHVDWQAERLFTVFGRAIHPDGTPLVDNLVKSKRGVGETDQNGYFQIETTADELLSFSGGPGEACSISTAGLDPSTDYAPLGKVICR